MSPSRLRPIAFGLAVLVMLSACSVFAQPPGGLPPMHAGELFLTGTAAVDWKWQEPANYSFAMEGGPAMITLAGQTKVVVRDHRVVQPDPSKGPPGRFPSIAEMQQRAEDTVARGGYVAAIVASDGRPTFLYMDPRDGFSDGEFKASMTDYQPE